MSAADNAAAVQAVNDAFNARDVNAAIALSTPDVETINMATGERFIGSDGLRQFFAGWMTAFPDGKVETVSITAGEQSAVIEFTGHGTQTGPLHSPSGDIPPTGRSTEIHFVSVDEFQQGKISRTRLYFDALGLMVQLGVIPAPARAQA